MLSPSLQSRYRSCWTRVEYQPRLNHWTEVSWQRDIYDGLHWAAIILPKKCLHLAQSVNVDLLMLIATFRLQYEDDYEYDFSVLSTRFRFGGRKLSKCACSEFKTRTPIWRSLIERLSMTFTANGKRQGGLRDQFFPRFLTFAGCSLPFSTRREVVSRTWKTWVKSVLFWAVTEILTILFVKARLILSFMVGKQLSFTDFIRKLWKKWNRKLRTVLCF